MALILNEENLKKAYFEVLATTGIGAAVNDGDLLLQKNVLVVVPESMHQDFPARLLGSAIHILAGEPYSWTVQNLEPTIDKDMTFQSLWDEWMTEIVMA